MERNTFFVYTVIASLVLSPFVWTITNAQTGPLDIDWCTEQLALNFSPDATIDDWSCEFSSWKRSSIDWNIAPAKEITEDDSQQSDENSSTGDGSWENTSGNEDPQSQDVNDGLKDIEDMVAAVVDDSIMECNETQYILARRAMLQDELYETVYIIPKYYSQLLGQEAIIEINNKVQEMKQMTPLQRNAMIESIVCKIEKLKEARNIKYSNIWAPANGNAADYVSQYLQDMMALGYVWN